MVSCKISSLAHNFFQLLSFSDDLQCFWHCSDLILALILRWLIPVSYVRVQKVLSNLLINSIWTAMWYYCPLFRHENSGTESQEVSWNHTANNRTETWTAALVRLGTAEREQGGQSVEQVRGGYNSKMIEAPSKIRAFVWNFFLYTNWKKKFKKHLDLCFMS